MRVPGRERIQPRKNSRNRRKGAASMREKWLASFGSDKEIWTLSEKGDVHEYLNLIVLMSRIWGTYYNGHASLQRRIIVFTEFRYD